MGHYQRSNIHIIGVPEGKKRNWAEAKLGKTMTKSFQKLMRETNSLIQETHQALQKVKHKIITTHIIVKMLKTKVKRNSQKQ